MSAGHWQRLRSRGMGPRGGGGGHDKGPLRKVVDHKMRLWVCADQNGVTPFVLYEGHDPAVALAKCREARLDPQWSWVRVREMGMDEILECGHAQLVVRDLIGPTNAARRRCSKCKAGKPADVPPPS